MNYCPEILVQFIHCWVWCTHQAVVQCLAHAVTTTEQAQHWQPPTEKLG